MDMTLGNRIAQLRRQKGLKQEDMAEALGVSPQAVSKWENDMNCPDISLLPDLAKLLEISVDELLSGKAAPVAVLTPEKKKELKDMLLRIVVDTNKGEKVRVNLPMALLQYAMESNVELNMFSGNDVLKNIDWKQVLEMVQQGVVGNLVEVESEDATVRIFVE